MSEIEKKRLIRCAAALSLALIGALLFLNAVSKGGFRIVFCPVRALTGYNCPGCGNTRALAALVHLKFAESLKYNYAYPVELLYLFYVVSQSCKNYVKQGKIHYYPKHPLFDYSLLALLLIWGIARNVFDF